LGHREGIAAKSSSLAFPILPASTLLRPEFGDVLGGNKTQGWRDATIS